TAFPRDKLGTGMLEKIVAGGAAKMAEAGIDVVGGHSVDDPEPKFGYTVIGEVNPKKAVGHAGAVGGDILFLTKPLGTGLVTTAIKRGLCPPELEAEAITVMTRLNREASELMVKARASAATDVTGYGLIGHLANLRGGAARGRRLKAPKNIRPTMDMVKQAIFNMVGPDIQGSTVLDLFAGSGALGIEALSRGAAAVTFVDQQPRGLAILRQNLDALGFKDRAHIVRGDVVRWVEASPDAVRKADFVFLDPPY